MTNLLRDRVRTAVDSVEVALIALKNWTPRDNDGFKVQRPKFITANIEGGEGVTLSIEFPVAMPQKEPLKTVLKGTGAVLLTEQGRYSPEET